jgi:hypothetical protein
MTLCWRWGDLTVAGLGIPPGALTDGSIPSAEFFSNNHYMK